MFSTTLLSRPRPTARLTSPWILIILMMVCPAVILGQPGTASADALSVGTVPEGATPRAEGMLLVVNKGESTLSVVDPRRGEELARIPTGDAPHEVAVSPDGRWAMVANYGTGSEPGHTLTLVDLESLEAVRDIDLEEQTRPHGITWHPDGDRVVVTTEGNGTLTVVDVEAGRVVAAIPTDQRVSHEVALSPDGRRAFVANIGSGSVSVIDLDQETLVRIIPTGAGAEGIAITPDGGEVWVSNRADNTLSIIDTQSLEVTHSLPSADFPIRVVMDPTGSRAFVTNARSGELRVFDVTTRTEILALTIDTPVVDAGPQVLAFEGSSLPIGVMADPDGRHAYVAAASSDVVAVVDLEEGIIVRTIAVGREPDGLAWRPMQP